MSKSQYESADEAKLKEIVRQAESRLSAQMSLAIAADQRAMTLASILATAAAALIAWAVSHNVDDAKLLPILVMIVGTIAAAGCALWSASPVAWDSPGNTPASWVDDIAEGKDDLHSARAAMADHYSQMIEWNRDLMASNANTLRAALIIIFLTLILGGISGVLIGQS